MSLRRLKTARENEFICEFATDVCRRSQPGATTARHQQQCSMPVLTTRPRRRSTLVTGRLRAACPVTVPSRHYERNACRPGLARAESHGTAADRSRARCSTYTRALAYRRRTPTGGDQCPTPALHGAVKRSYRCGPNSRQCFLSSSAVPYYNHQY